MKRPRKDVYLGVFETVVMPSHDSCMFARVGADGDVAHRAILRERYSHARNGRTKGYPVRL